MKGVRLLCPALLAVVFWVCVPGYAQSPESKKPPYLDPSLPVDVRVKDLVGRMTLQEKISQTLNNAPAIERLQVPAYDWWNEALHGVARAGVATVFPQAIGLAAMWDEPHLFTVATAISDEARAKHHEFVRQGQRGRYQGLTFWSPNINIFRDPRWGRGMETYGEDPYLTGRLGIAFIKGLQGEDPKYFKVIATSKHFAVHRGPEPARHIFDAQASDRDLYETYLPTSRKRSGRESLLFHGRLQPLPRRIRQRAQIPAGNLLRGRWALTGTSSATAAPSATSMPITKLCGDRSKKPPLSHPPRLRPELRQCLQGARGRHPAGASHGKGAGCIGPAPLHRPHEAGDV
jgi:hypothetical protein